MPNEPVEYRVAVDRFLAASRISESSRRVYRVALETWGWLLVGRTPPGGFARRGAQGPVVLLGRLDGPDAARTVVDALDARALMVDRRTFVREASILRNTTHWWVAQGWIGPDAEGAIRAYRPRTVDGPDGAGAKTAAALDVAVDASVDAAAAAAAAAVAVDPGDAIDIAAVFRLRAALREQTLWRLIYESAAPIEHLLALDTSDLDFARRGVRRQAGPRAADRIGWGPLSAELLPLLTIGRAAGPVFLTERRAAGRVPAADRCPYTRRARLSARRAAELFQAATGEIDPAGRGWNLRDLRLAGRRTRTR